MWLFPPSFECVRISWSWQCCSYWRKNLKGNIYHFVRIKNKQQQFHLCFWNLKQVKNILKIVLKDQAILRKMEAKIRWKRGRNIERRCYFWRGILLSKTVKRRLKCKSCHFWFGRSGKITRLLLEWFDLDCQTKFIYLEPHLRIFNDLSLNFEKWHFWKSRIMKHKCFWPFG